MKIILYKKCILSNSYSEVFDVFHKTKDPITNEETVALQRYLSSLTKYEITADNVYVPNSGKITLELDFDYENVSNNIYEYNYMYLEDTDNNFRRYCFIDDITVVNGLAVISFSEDIWSNYASSMEIRKSLLVRSRATKYGDWSIPFYAPGMEYEGNNELQINELFEKPQAYRQVAIICQVQLYQLSEQGTVSKREIYEFFVSNKVDTQSSYILMPVQSAYSTILDLIAYSSVNKISYNNEEWNYEIYNIILLPEIFNVSFEVVSPISVLKKSNVTICINLLPDSVVGNESIIYTAEKTINCNFKQFRIGTILSAFDVVQNGTPLKVKLGYFASKTEFGLYINFQNQIYDITNDFLLELPVSVQTADVTQQQASARELKTMNAKLGIANGALQIRKGMLDTSIGFGSMLLGGAVGGVSGIGLMTGGAGGFASGTSEIGKGITSIIGSKKELEIANRAQFVSNRGVKLLTNTALIANYGIVIFEIQPDNEIEVQANIDNIGYVCNEIVDDLFNKPITDEVATGYNVMRFDFANIFGNFTQNIAKALRAILYNGFKIWYDETKINV